MVFDGIFAGVCNHLVLSNRLSFMKDGNQAPCITQFGEVLYLSEKLDGMGCVGPVSCGQADCEFGLYRTLEESSQEGDVSYNPGCARCGLIGLSLMTIFEYGRDNLNGGITLGELEVPRDFVCAAAVELASRNNLSSKLGGCTDIRNTTLLSRLLMDGGVETVNNIIKWAKVASDLGKHSPEVK